MTDATKLTVLVSSLSGGGAERVATTLCNAWCAAGCSVTLTPTFDADSSAGYPLDPGIQVRRLPAVPGPKTPWRQLRRLRALRRLITSERPDLVITFLTNVNVAGLLAAWGTGVPVIVCERIHPPLFPLSFWWRALRQLTYPMAHTVVVQTETTRAWFASNLPRAKTSVIPNPLALPLPDGPAELPIAGLIDSDQRLILAVGRLDPQKGFEDLLEAFALLSHETLGWRLVILGEGPQRQALERTIEQLAIGGRATLPGWAGNMQAWYARADLFVLTSRYEGFPNALLEAMAHGVACIAYDCPAGPAELIDGPDCGRLMPPDQGVTGLTRALVELVGDAPMRESLGQRARERAQSFSQPKVLQRWAQLIGGGR